MDAAKRGNRGRVVLLSVGIKGRDFAGAGWGQIVRVGLGETGERGVQERSARAKWHWAIDRLRAMAVVV